MSSSIGRLKSPAEKPQRITVARLPILDKERAREEARDIEGQNPPDIAEALIALSPNPTVLVDPNNQEILLQNEAFSDFLGDSENSLTRYLSTETRSQINIGKRDLPNQTILTREGTTMNVHIQVRSVIHENQTVWLISIAETLQETREELDRLKTRLKDARDMAGQVRHNINNIAGVVLGNADLIEAEEKQLSNETIDILECIKEAATSITRTVDNFLSPGNKNTFKMKDLKEVIKTVKNFLLYWEYDPKIKILLDIEDGDYESCLNEGTIVDMLLNILLNSKRVTPSGGEIKVKLSESDSKGVIIIEITDQGPGIPKHILDKVFQQGTTTKECEGHGIGLASVLETARKHNGQVLIETSTEKNNHFTSVKILLPKLTKKPTTSRQS